MGGLLNPKSGAVRATGFVVHGIRFSNAAAKFWLGLFREIEQDFPDCTTVELTVLGGEPLSRSMLFPELELEAGLNRLAKAGYRETLEAAVAELELLGAPSAVGVRLLADSKEFLRSELPLDCLDSETFPRLLVWIVEWAGIPQAVWNSEAIEGAFAADDPQSSYRYDVRFRLESRHVSEGLYERKAVVRFRRGAEAAG